jgi:hypothetical protein
VNAGDLERVILAWWEDEANRVADCKNDLGRSPRPKGRDGLEMCENHVFEEAVRVPGGAIVACTVHGDRLAASLAAHLIQVDREEEERLKRLALETPINLAFLGPDMTHLDDAEHERITRELTVRPLYGPRAEAAFRQEREGRWPTPMGTCGGRFGGARCTCLTAEEHDGGRQP